MTRLLTWYGDDFTGSTDVMEALVLHGVETVLFTRLPTETEFAPFANHAAIGLAGSSRSRTPEWMDQNLSKPFEWLRGLGARFCHYKVCSTFDSSPGIGNIGRATEIGLRIFRQDMAPLVVGTPQLRRYTFGGNLFAAYRGEVFRIDRHPVMSRHPVTPMDEADLRLHLAHQTDLPVALANDAFPQTGLGLIDVYDAATQLAAGRRLLAFDRADGTFVVGASGVEYALVKALAEAGTISGQARFDPVPPVDRLMVVSGSVSPTTERQIRHALGEDFAGVPLDALALAEGDGDAVGPAVAKACEHLESGRSVIAYTALGAASDAGATLDALPEGRRLIGEGLGRILRLVIERCGLRRAVIAGGDSSSHGLGQLDVHALTTRFPLVATPGSPLCRAWSASPALDGVEIAMKGGQLGGDDYFVRLRDRLQ